MKAKIVLFSLLAILLLAIGGGLYWSFMRSQTIVLADGTRLTLVGVTYGKHHTPPKSKVNGHKLRNSPVTTEKDSLCLWIRQEHQKNNWPNYQIFVYDPAETGCSGESSRSWPNNGMQGDEVIGYVFEAFPRHSSRIYFRVQGWNNRNGQQDMPKEHFSIHNPAPKSGYPNWTPDALPDAQQDGDLQATLTKFERADNAFNFYGRSPNNGDFASRGVTASFHIEQNGIVVTNWKPVEIETMDATGNHSRNRSRSERRDADEASMTYQWALWPDEPAWKLRVEMSRTSGFNSDEIWSTSDIPLKAGDMNDSWQPNKRGKAASETILGDYKIQVYPCIQMNADKGRMYGGMEGILLIRIEPPPDGMRLTVIKITDEQNNPLEFRNWGGGGNEHRFAITKLGDAKSISVTLALHKSRYFEYTIKPPGKG